MMYLTIYIYLSNRKLANNTCLKYRRRNFSTFFLLLTYIGILLGCNRSVSELRVDNLNFIA